MQGREGLLLVGHGSQSADSETEMRALADLVAGHLSDVIVDVGFLEMTNPSAGVVLDRLVAQGCRRVVVLPLVLLGAGHAKNDVAAVVLEGRQRHPTCQILFGSPLGVAKDLVAAMGDAVVSSGGRGLPLLLVARGTSDPDANGDAAKAARLVAEWSGAPFVHTGFTGVTGPTVPHALEVFARLGIPGLVLGFWFLCTGKLIERARADVADFCDRTGVTVIDAGYFGPDPRLVPIIVERYGQAQIGTPVVNCDSCSYRAPWPGHEDRVGQPMGVGHSHLAVEHRHAHR
ncbi:MAG: sirohydrochlorin chelatase [Acidimicrobiales bacterium]